MQLRQNLSDALNTIRTEQNLTLADLAGKLDIARSCLQQMLQGHGNPSLNTVERMSEQLKVDPVVLLSVSQQKSQAEIFLHMMMYALQLPEQRQQALEELVMEIIQLWEDTES